MAAIVATGLIPASTALAQVQSFETTATPLVLDHGVHVQKVKFPNGAIPLAGNLLTPASFDPANAYTAIVVTHPNGA